MAKKYHELELADDFLFCKIMSSNPDLCKHLIESILDVKVGELKTHVAQLSAKTTKDSKGVRFDVYADNGAFMFDVEIQTVLKKNLPKRSRFYQSIMDVTGLESGEDYEQLRESYVIFICLEDPFGNDRSIYTFKNVCMENRDLLLNDGTSKIFVNAGKTSDLVNEDLIAFLKYISGKECAGNNFVSKLKKQVEIAKDNEVWAMEFIQMGLVYHDVRVEALEEGMARGIEQGMEQGRATGIYECVSDGGYTPERGAKKLGCTVAELCEQMEAAGFKVPNME